MSARTSITVKSQVYSRLKEYGKFGESYSSLIARLLDLVDGIDKESEITA